MSMEDIQIISAVFAGLLIIEGFGKVSTKFSLGLAIKKAARRPPE
jgi:hypothetical protein